MRFCNWVGGRKGSDSAREHFEKGIDLESKGKLNESIECFSKALILSPSVIEARLARADDYSLLREWDEAIADFSEVLSSKPKSLEALEGRALAYASKDNEIVERYERAGGKQYRLNFEELDMPRDNLLRSVAPDKAMWIRTTFELMELRSAARKDAEEAIRLDPSNNVMHQLLKELSE